MEELRKYLNSLSAEEQSAFAKRCKTSVGYLRKAISQKELIREKTCTYLELESGGQVSRKSLRPDDWQSIWPELIQDETSSNKHGRTPTRRKGDKALIAAIKGRRSKVVIQ